MASIAHKHPVAGGVQARIQRMLPALRWGGFVAGILMVAFGIGAIVNGLDGRSTTRDLLQAENIVGSPDMTPAKTQTALKEAGLAGKVAAPDCSVAGATIDTGSEARCFSQYMRIHTLEATSGAVYADMGRFQAKPDAPQSALAPGGGTSDEQYAVTDAKTGKPVSNAARDIWVTRTALSTALDTSYMAERISVFGIVVGIALLLGGIGFILLAAVALHRTKS